jgi:hypothetical protein
MVSGATTAITRRTNMRKAFLAPWHPLVRDIWLYSIALAQHATDVAVHLGSLVVTHHHVDVTPSKDNLPEFTRRLHHDMSCALNTLLSNERYDSPRELWDGRRPHYMRLMDEAAQASHLVYEHINPVAAGLVDRPEHMPDFAFGFGLWKTGFIEIERPPLFFSDDCPKCLRLCVTPPPLLLRAFGGDVERLVYHMGKLSEHAIQSVRRARNRPVAGAKKVSRIHPWSEPRTMRESGGQKRPTFRFGARGIVTIATEAECAREVRAFRERYRETFEARRGGDLEPVYPFGTYQMRAIHRAPTEPLPPLDAIVARPGPLLSDIYAELERQQVSREEALASSAALTDSVREAFANEAAEIEQATAFSFLDEVPVRYSAAQFEGKSAEGKSAEGKSDAEVGPSEQAATETRAASVVVRHRFDRRTPVHKDAARRVVVLRDVRRGRPRRTDRHGNDPPV